MDKQTATNHVLLQIKAGKSRDSIAAQLSQRLNAPLAVVGRFVDKVIADHPGVFAQPADPIAPPEEMGSHQFGHSDLPPGLRKLLQESTVHPNSDPAQSPNPTHGDPSHDQLTSQQNDHQFPVGNPLPKEISMVDLGALKRTVFHQLKKQNRHNDIVEEVCKVTGWHWNQSQRFVARVQTDRHEELQTGKHKVLMIIGIGIILGGIFLVVNGFTAITDFARLIPLSKNNPTVLMDADPQVTIYAVAAVTTGIGLIIGGGCGILRSVSDH